MIFETGPSKIFPCKQLSLGSQWDLIPVFLLLRAVHCLQLLATGFQALAGFTVSKLLVSDLFTHMTQEICVMCVLHYQVNFRTSLSLGQQNKVPGLALTCGIRDLAGHTFSISREVRWKYSHNRSNVLFLLMTNNFLSLSHRIKRM